MKTKAYDSKRAGGFRFIKTLNYFLALSLLWWYTTAILKSSVNADAGYYLSSAEKIHEGMMPFRDLALHYSPLPIFLWSLIWDLIPNVSYGCLLSVVLLFELTSLCLLFGSLRTLGVEGTTSVFASLVAGHAILLHDGTYIVLEPFVIFFSLLALFLYLKWRERLEVSWLFAAGLACGFSFLSKQYGVSVLFALATDLILTKWINVQKLKQVLILMFGGAVPVVSCLLLLWLFEGIKPLEIFTQLSGGRYPIHVTSHYEVLFFALLACPFLVLLPLYMRKGKRILGPFLSMLFWYSLPLMVNQYSHYFILLVPFAIGVGAAMIHVISQDDTESRWWRVSLVFVSFWMLVFTSIQNLWTLIDSQKRVEQYSAASQMTGLVSSNESAWLLANQAYNYLARLKAPFPAELGYSFPVVYSLNESLKALRCSRFIILDRNADTFVLMEERFRRAELSLLGEVQRNAELIGRISGGIEVWRVFEPNSTGTCGRAAKTVGKEDR